MHVLFGAGERTKERKCDRNETFHLFVNDANDLYNDAAALHSLRSICCCLRLGFCHVRQKKTKRMRTQSKPNEKILDV